MLFLPKAGKNKTVSRVQNKLMFYYAFLRSSSIQNPPDKDNNSCAQKLSDNEDFSENREAENSAETVRCSNLVQKTDISASNRISITEPHFSTSNEKGRGINLEEEKVKNSDAEKFSENLHNRRLMITYEAQQKIRQPFFLPKTQPTATNRRLPAPPSYYASSNLNPPAIRSTAEKAASSQDHRLQIPYYPLTGELAIFSDIFVYAAHWAPYPTSIPSNAPPHLAHLIDAEVVFIIQKIDFIYFLTGYPDLNMFLILNKNNEYLYYAYETTNFCGQMCMRNARNFQIHILDMYQNEVIYLNKPCGCTYLFCCYPVIEVYSPPMVPVGAIRKVFHPYREEYVILDPDENAIFKISGNNTVIYCCNYYEFTFSIHALDNQNTVVGYIRRDFSGYFRAIFTDPDIYGVSFPKNMDARMKAVFLGALFLIDIIYFDDRD